MELSKELKELLKERDREYRERHPLTSEERHKEIVEASNSITLDDYNPEEKWTFWLVSSRSLDSHRYSLPVHMVNTRHGCVA